MTEKNDKKPWTLDAVKVVGEAVKGHPIVVGGGVILAAIILIGNAIDAITKIRNFVNPPSQSTSVGEADQTPTAENRVGIWVARIRGDNDHFSAQRELVQNLLRYLEKDPNLKNNVEVRELTQEITGASELDKDVVAKAAGKQVHATMVIWGEIVDPFKVSEFFPRVTIVSPMVPGTTFRLETVTENLRRDELIINPPNTSRVAPERIVEPIRLARFILAVQNYNTGRFVEAIEQFERLIQDQPNKAYISDVHFYAGFSSYKQYFHTHSKTELQKAQAQFLNALKASEGNEDWIQYPNALNNLGITYFWMSETEVSPQPFLEEAKRLVEEAAELWKKRGNDLTYWEGQANIASIYRNLARRGIDPERNFLLSLKLNEQISDHAMKAGHWVVYSFSKVTLGQLLLDAAKRDVEVIPNLKRAVQQFEAATRHDKTHSPWGIYIAGEGGLATALSKLLRLGVDINKNLPKCVAAWDEVANIYGEHKQWEKYADVQMSKSMTFVDVAEKGFDVNENMTKGIIAGKEAASRFRELRTWEKYAEAQGYVFNVYKKLYDLKINGYANLQQMKTVLDDGIDVFHQYGLSNQEMRFKERLEEVSKALAGGDKHSRSYQMPPSTLRWPGKDESYLTLRPRTRPESSESQQSEEDGLPA